MDRFIRGFLAGVTGGIVMNIWDFISYYILKISNDRFLDWAAIMIYGDKPVTIFATILALFAQLLFAGIMGIIFAYLIKLINSRDILFKGAIWGIGSSFILYAVPVIFKIADLTTTSVLTTFSHFIGTTLWGLVLAQVLHWLNDKPRIEV